MLKIFPPLLVHYLKKHPPRVLLYIFIIGFTARLCFCFIIWGIDRPPVDDGRDYYRIAVSLTEGSGFAGKTGITARRPPLYPFFISWIENLSLNTFVVVRLVQCFLGALLPLFIFDIARRMYRIEIGFIAACIAALYPIFIFLPSRFLTENLFTFLVLLAIWYFVRFEESGIHAYFIFGSLCGLAILTRPSLLLFLPLFVLWGFLRFRKKTSFFLLSSFLFSLGAFLVVSPWSLRNYLVFGSFVPVTTNAGITFMHDNNPYLKEMGWAGPQNRIFRPEVVYSDLQDSRAWLQMNEAAQDNYLMKRTRQWIGDNPSEFMYLLPRKVISFFNFRQASNTAELKTILMDIVSFLSYGILLPFMLIGFFWTLRVSPLKDTLLHLLIFSFLVGVILYAGSVRLRVPIEPYLIIFSSFTIHALFFNRAENRG